MQRVNESDLAYRGGDSGVKYMIRGPHIDWGVLLLRPGERLGGHYHQQVEETFYVVEGRGTFLVNGERLPAAAGEAFRMAATDRHDIVNDSTTPMKLLFMKTPFLPDDKVNV